MFIHAPFVVDNVDFKGTFDTQLEASSYQSIDPGLSTGLTDRQQDSDGLVLMRTSHRGY